MKKHILCLGDSNTHGYCADPADCADHGIRFNEDERWTCRLQTALGSEYLVTEEGLSGRTTVFVDPIHESMDALSVAYALLKSHEVIDLLIIMLGTNDVKERFNANAACIGAGMERLILKAKSVDCWGTKAPNILVVAPHRRRLPRRCHGRGLRGEVEGRGRAVPHRRRAAGRPLPRCCRLRIQSGGFHAPDPSRSRTAGRKVGGACPDAGVTVGEKGRSPERSLGLRPFLRHIFLMSAHKVYPETGREGRAFWQIRNESSRRQSAAR